MAGGQTVYPWGCGGCEMLSPAPDGELLAAARSAILLGQRLVVPQMLRVRKVDGLKPNSNLEILEFEKFLWRCDWLVEAKTINQHRP